MKAGPEFNAESGVWEYMLASDYQARPVLVEILLPSELKSGVSYPVMYILPVGGVQRSYGDGLQEARKADIANRFDVICVAPYFSAVPWYGDHATNPKVRQESHLIKAVVPFIDSTYPTQKDSEGRWLLGFSKSGWGAFTLIMRNPDVFGYAAAWDAPLMLKGEGQNWGPMGLRVNFGEREAMLKSLPTTLARQNAARLQERTRLVLAPGKHWRGQTVNFHRLLNELAIPHKFREDLLMVHRWDTGWFAPLAEDLVEAARAVDAD